MNKNKLTRVDLISIIGSSVVVDGKNGVWKVINREAKNCLCRKPFLGWGNKDEWFHFSKLSFAPEKH